MAGPSRCSGGAASAPHEVHLARERGRLRGLMVPLSQHEPVPGACTSVHWMPTGFAPVVVTAPLARGFVRAPSAQTLERRLTFQIHDEHLNEEWLAEHWW